MSLIPKDESTKNQVLPVNVSTMTAPIRELLSDVKSESDTVGVLVAIIEYLASRDPNVTAVIDSILNGGDPPDPTGEVSYGAGTFSGDVVIGSDDTVGLVLSDSANVPYRVTVSTDGDLVVTDIS